MVDGNIGMRLNIGITLPEKWKFLPLKRLTRFGYGDALSSDDRLPGAVKVFGSNGPFDQHSSANTLAPCIIIGRKGSYGKLQYSEDAVFAVDTTFIIDERHTSADLKFLYYLLSTLGLDELSDDTAIPGLSRAKAYQSLSPVPPLETQRHIARFLDEKTARIDGLIEKKRALLERLAEKRQALITRAVTKGLNPDAPMKPSGIEWLGDIPAHWEAGNIRRFAKMKTGHTPSRSIAEYWDDCTIPWFSLSDVWQLRDGTRWYLEETAERISEIGLANSAAELLPAGTVVFSRTASIGYSGIMPEAMATTQDFWNWICGPKLTPEYLLLLFRSMTQKFDESTSGSTHKTIYRGIAAGLHICVAPLQEQKEIARYVLKQASEIDIAAEKVSASVEKLKEYRSALITATVTGQLEVA